MNNNDRGTGRTTKQMESAEKGAVFVWCNSDIEYPISIAKKIGRDDLKIVRLSWLDGYIWRGTELSGLIIDHDCRLSDNQINAISMIKPLIRNK